MEEGTENRTVGSTLCPPMQGLRVSWSLGDVLLRSALLPALFD